MSISSKEKFNVKFETRKEKYNLEFFANKDFSEGRLISSQIKIKNASEPLNSKQKIKYIIETKKIKHTFEFRANHDFSEAILMSKTIKIKFFQKKNLIKNLMKKKTKILKKIFQIMSGIIQKILKYKAPKEKKIKEKKIKEKKENIVVQKDNSAELNEIQKENINTIDESLKFNFYKFIEASFSALNPKKQFYPSKHIDFMHMVLMKMCWKDMPKNQMDPLYHSYMEAADEQEFKNVIFNLPPRELKSTIISIIWPAWILGHAPHSRILIASSSSRLARSLVLQTKMLMQTDWFQKLFPNCALQKGGNNAQIFYTTQNGYRMGCSLGENIIGYGADYLIMDDPEDPVKIQKKLYREKSFDWFQTVFASRANDKLNSRILLCTARMHEDDLTQKFLNQNDEKFKIFDLNQARKIEFLKFNQKEDLKKLENYELKIRNISFFNMDISFNSRILQDQKSPLFSFKSSFFNCLKKLNFKGFKFSGFKPKKKKKQDFVINLYELFEENAKKKSLEFFEGDFFVSYKVNRVERFYKKISCLNYKISFNEKSEKKSINSDFRANEYKQIFKINPEIKQNSFKNKTENKKEDEKNFELWKEFKFPIINKQEEELIYEMGGFEIKFKSNEELNPKRYNSEFLENLKLNLGDHQFNSQYLQKPIGSSEAMLKKEHVTYYDIFEIKDDLIHGSHEIIQSWDMASSEDDENNYTVCTTWAIINDFYYLIDAIRVRAHYEELKELIVSQYKKFSAPNFFKEFFEEIERELYL